VLRLRRGAGARGAAGLRRSGELVRVRTLAIHADADVADKARADEIGFDIVRSRMQGAREGLSADLVA
jgi:hypothetical protein